MAQDYYAVIAHPDAFKNTASPTAPVQIGLGPQTTQGYPLGVGTTPPFSVPRWIYFQPEHQSMFLGMNAGGSGASGVLADGEGNTIIGNNAGVNMKAGGGGDNTCLGANNFYLMTGAETAMTIDGAPANATYSQAATSPYITLKVNGVSVFEVTDVNELFRTVATQIDALPGWSCYASAGAIASGWYIVPTTAGNGKIYTDLPITPPTAIEAVLLGGYNTAIGVDSQVNLTYGFGNTSTGKLALYSNVIGNENCAFGRNALNAYLGDYASAFGTDAGRSVTTATFFNAFGHNALRNLTTGDANCAIGAGALKSLVTGTNNCAVGNSAGDATLGSENTLVGNNTGLLQSNVNGTTAIGYLAHGGSDIAGDAIFIIGPQSKVSTYDFDGTTVTIKEDGVAVQTYLAADAATDTFRELADKIYADRLLAGSTWSVSYSTWFSLPTSSGVVTNAFSVRGANGTTPTYSFDGTTITLKENGSPVGTYTAANYATYTDLIAALQSAHPTWTFTASSFYYESPANGVTYTNLDVSATTFIRTGIDASYPANKLRGRIRVKLSGQNSYNVAIGHTAMASAKGTNNVAIGALAMYNANCVSSDNVCIGLAAGYSLTVGHNNVHIGANTGTSQTTGYENVAIGSGALALATSAYRNTSIGFESLRLLAVGYDNSALGWHAGRGVTGINNTAIGSYSLEASSTGSDNTAVGYAAGNVITSGQQNSLLGSAAGLSLTTGSYNTISGYAACQTTTTASYNAVYGYHALRQGSGSYNVAIGASSLSKADNTASNNVAIGASTGAELTTGTRNVLIGNNQGLNVSTGSGNVMVGASTLVVGADITGNSNILVGDDIDLEDRTASNQINIGTRYYHDRIRLAERSADPIFDTYNNFWMWLSDGTGLGDDGDVLIASNIDGQTRYAILFDRSAGEIIALTPASAPTIVITTFAPTVS